MSFAISNIVYLYQGNLENQLSNTSNIITGIIDFALIASTSIIGGLIIGGVLNFGIPMGVGTIGNYIAWGFVGLGGGIAITDIIAAIVIKCSDSSTPKVEVCIAENANLVMEIPTDGSKSRIEISGLEIQKWVWDWKLKNRTGKPS